MNSLARKLLRSAPLSLCVVLALSLPAQEAPMPAPATEPAVAADDDKTSVPAAQSSAQESKPAAKESAPFGNHSVPANTTQSTEAVSFWGTTTIDGELNNKAVSVFGKTVVNGRTANEAVALFGDLEINGRIEDKAVVLFGDLKLGEKAVIEGDAIVVLGKLDRHPGAVVRGQINQALTYGKIPQLAAFTPWVNKCLRFGRLLGFDEGLRWAWIFAGVHLALYLLLALVFRGSLVKCAETFEQHPGHSIMAAIFTVILTPLLFVLLAITGIGLLVIPFLLIGLFFAGWFGRAAMHAWTGRLITRHFGDSPFAHVAVSVLIGGIIISLLACVPVLGLGLHGLIGFLGLGVVIYTLVLSMKRETSAVVTVTSPTPSVAPLALPVAPAISITTPLHGSPSPTAVLGSLLLHSSAPPPPPPPPECTLQHAGFWRRVGALGVDVVLCGILASIIGNVLHAVPVLHIGSDIGFRGFLLLLAVYGAVMWRLRASTIGGIVFQLKIVRLNEGPIDWTTAIVRALGCFLSLVVAGLGFFWIAFDGNRQSWHDKIAGTIVVRASKGPSLV